MLTLHLIWPFLWIWATLYRPERGYGFGGSDQEPESTNARLAAMDTRLQAIEKRLPNAASVSESSTTDEPSPIAGV